MLLIGMSFLLVTMACSLVQRISQGVQISQAERVWQETAIEDYQIKVLVVQSIWHAQSHTITVESGQVVESSASCTPAPMEFKDCQVRDFDAADFTVPGLFAKARDQTELGNNRWSVITFNASYGYPNKIAYDHPEIMDEDWAWRVVDFQVMK